MSEEHGNPFQRLQEMHEMYQSDSVHRVMDLIDSLDKESLNAFDMILASIINQGIEVAHYWAGCVTERARREFGICPCGHTEEDLRVDMDQPNSAEPMPGTREQVASGEFTTDPLIILAAMQDYGLTVNDDEEISCKNCGMTYVSIEDRMLRPKGKPGCPGCVQKEQWG